MKVCIPYSMVLFFKLIIDFMTRITMLVKVHHLQVVDLHFSFLKQFMHLKTFTKKSEKADRSLRVTLAFLHIMMDSEATPHDPVVLQYQTLHRNVTKDLNSSQGLKWLVMILESFHLNDCCIPFHSGETYQNILVSASKHCGNAMFPLEAFMKSLEHVQNYE